MGRIQLLRPAAPSVEGAHVAILGLGPSLEQYMSLARGLGGRRKLADETWAINALGDVFACDRVFHMDDVRIQQVRADARPQSNIAEMLRWLKTHPGPVYTSTPHEAFPGLVAYPLEAVINDLGSVYFNNTAAYAMALAIHERAAVISLWGCDFTYPNAHHAEKGRACLEFWCGFARARSIEVNLPETSSLLDSCEFGDAPHAPLYGFGRTGSADALIVQDAAGRFAVTFEPRPDLPSAEEIEAAYDHSKHPSPLMSGQAA